MQAKSKNSIDVSDIHPRWIGRRLDWNARIPRYVVLVISMLLVITCGCHTFSHRKENQAFSGQSEIPNPLTVPMLDRWFVMDQVSYELGRYFKILREERIQVHNGVMSEGWIETHTEMGSTIFEPWRRDSTRGFEKRLATLQTIRRFAKVRVIPSGNSYLIDVKVYKELEDLETPIGAAVSGRGLRHDNSLDVDRSDQWVGERKEGWIPMGRDFSLEQLILRKIQARLAEDVEGVGAPPAYQ